MQESTLQEDSILDIDMGTETHNEPIQETNDFALQEAKAPIAFEIITTKPTFTPTTAKVMETSQANPNLDAKSMKRFDELVQRGEELVEAANQPNGQEQIAKLLNQSNEDKSLDTALAPYKALPRSLHTTDILPKVETIPVVQEESLLDTIILPNIGFIIAIPLVLVIGLMIVFKKKKQQRLLKSLEQLTTERNALKH